MIHRVNNKKHYQKFLLQCLILLVIVWTIDFTIGNGLRYFYFKQKGEDYRTTYSMENTTADLLIFGSSRGNRQYHPDVFEKRLGLSCYNVSRQGQFMFYHDAVLKSILKRYTPKVVILDFRVGEFKKNKDNYDRLYCLLPYYKNHPEIRPLLEQRGKYEKLKLISAIYPFNSDMYKIALRNLPSYREEHAIIKGYVYYDNVWNRPIQKANDSKDYSIDSNIVKSYEYFIKSCVERKIKVLVVVPPYFSIKEPNDVSITMAKEIAKRNAVKFIDYSQDTVFLNRRELIADPIHLNNNGAIVLSAMLVDSLNKNK